MDGLNTREIIKLHDMLVKRYGGTSGTMIEGTIDHLVYHQLSPYRTVYLVGVRRPPFSNGG